MGFPSGPVVRICLPMQDPWVRKLLWRKSGTPLQYSCLENPMDGGAWKAAVHGVAEGRTRLSDFTFTFHFHALEKEMATHSSVLAWRVPGTGEPGGLLSMGLHKVGHVWSDLAAGEGNGKPFQYSRLENLIDRGAWQTTVHGIAKTQTWLSDRAHIYLLILAVAVRIFECGMPTLSCGMWDLVTWPGIKPAPP